MMRAIFWVVLTTLCLSGCYPVETTTQYNKSWTKGHSSSEPIYLSFRDNKKSSFHFLLNHQASSDEYILRVLWSTRDDELIFNGMKTTLKFMIDNADIITLSPIKGPKIVAYNLETKGHEEEAVFKLTYDQLKTIAYGKNVEVELNGKYITVIGQFNKRHTSKAFRDFIDNG